MPVISYDYLPKPFVKNDKLSAIYTPVIPIRLSVQHKLYKNSIYCLVDSGADHNLFPADIGELLGLKIKKGEKVEHTGIGDVGILAYRHPVKLFLEGYSFQTFADFSFDHKIPLLGRDDFFTCFKRVIFNETKRQLHLEY